MYVAIQAFNQEEECYMLAQTLERMSKIIMLCKQHILALLVKLFYQLQCIVFHRHFSALILQRFDVRGSKSQCQLAPVI